MLTLREKEVLQLISHGNTTKQIAQNLYISNHTVVQHRKNLLRKMNAANTAQLIRKGFERAIIN